MDGRTSPLKPKNKQESARSTGKQVRSGSVDDGGSKLHPPGRMAKPPLHIRSGTNVTASKGPQKTGPDGSRGSSVLSDMPRRTRSNPSYTANPPARYANQLPSIPPRSSGEVSPNQQHKQMAAGSSRRPSFQHSASIASSQLDPARQKLVDRATKARLYFLRKSGPNRFLIGGDSTESRFNVTIGPQSCSCNRSHCVHILFVMLRVFKLPQNDPNLWRKPLKDYEAESLLRDHQTRQTQRRSSKKTLERGQSMIDSPTSRPVEQPTEVITSDSTTQGESEKTAPVISVSSEDPTAVKSGGGVRSGAGDSEKSEGEEEVCPICLNELDEGEDLLVCSNGCNNQLHQHCMDVWAAEQNKKNEDVYCPVCRATWSYNGPPSLTSPTVVPQEGAGARVSSPGHVILSDTKQVLHNKVKSTFGIGAAEDLFSPDWKHREAALGLLARESISYLLPHVTAKFQSRADPDEKEESAQSVQELCMQIVAHACNDSVLKVFLAALELLRVILGYSVCYSAKEANNLQTLLRPVLPVLLTRCADAQRRVKECSIDTTCNLCLGQEGPLSVGSCCGHQASCGISNVRLILTVALEQASGQVHAWNWWLGRLTLMEKLLARFSWEFLLPQCMLKPLSPQPSIGFDSDTDDSHSDLVSPEDSITSSVSAAVSEAPSPEIKANPVPDLKQEDPVGMVSGYECGPDSMSPIVQNNLLMQCWYFAAKATHVSHHKVSKVARRVIIRIAKILRDDPSALEVIHDVTTKCHRSAAEGLLDKVLQAREKPQESLVPRKNNSISKSERVSIKPRRLHSPSQPVVSRQEGLHVDTHTLSREVSEDSEFGTPLSGIDVEKSLSLFSTPKRSSSPRVKPHPLSREASSEPLSAVEIPENEFVNSEDSFKSAVSELDRTLLESEHIQERNKNSDGTEEGSSSTSNSHDSRSGDLQLRSDSAASGGGVVRGGDKRTLPVQQPYYKRQSTVDSAFGSEFDSSLDSATTQGVFPCKTNVEEEEAEALAKVRSLTEDPPHPSLSNLVPPSEEVLVYVQNTVGNEGREGTDSYSMKPYIEGFHWKKGKVIGTGAFCTCHLARDLENGTMFAVKQVSYVRNTKQQEEEELTRLREEIAMLGRLSHPNIVRCLGATQQDGHINIFVEWMAGGCLDIILCDFGPLKESVICNYTRQICLGIVYLHEHQVIHRDLKGGNILLDSTGRRIRIADFGSSARLAANTTGSGEFQDMEGTVAFMAPEVVRGGTYDDSTQPSGYGRKCDVWSIGCVIVQMATAKPPWVGTYDVKNKYQLIFKIGQATAPPPLPSFSNPALKDLMIRCMEVNPTDRPTSFELLKHPLFTESLESL